MLKGNCIFAPFHANSCAFHMTNRINSLVAELNILAKRKKTFNKERFRVFMMQHQAALRPAFQIQSVLQHKICGVAFWDEQTQNRKALCPDSYVSVAQILDPVCKPLFISLYAFFM